MSTREVPQPGEWPSNEPPVPAGGSEERKGPIEVGGARAEVSSELFRQVVEVAPALLCIFDLGSRQCVYANRRVRERLGYTAREIVLDGEPLHPEDRERVRADLKQFDERPGQEILEHEFRVRRADGTWRWLCARNVVLSRDDQGRARRMLAIGEDVTERKRMEEALRRANAELARSNRELEDFAALVAHDLRAPLVSLSGCATFLKEAASDSLSDECMEMVGYIEEGAQQLGRMISSVLEYSRAGHVRLTSRSCNMAEVLRRTLNRLQADLERAKARITFDPLPVVEGDEELLGQVLQNLIENALRYRSEKRPELHIGVREEEGFEVFWVRDNGIGIAPEHFDRIFKVFERVRQGRPGSGGLGVGLATCKRVMEKHGGRIWVESSPGAGSTFYFALPKK